MRTLALVLCASLVPAVAWPCGNAIYRDTKEEARLVARAEKLIKQGRYAAARTLLTGDEAEIADAALRKRQRFLVAVADIRLDQPQRGVSVLRALLSERGSSPEIETRLAEGLARAPGGEKEALAILSRLEEDDLIVDAAGWLVLARLRADGGDADGAARAIQRCRKIAGAAACSAAKVEPHS